MEQPFWGHIEELRARLMRCLYVLLATSTVGYLVRQPVLHFLKAPLFKVLPADKQNLYFTGLFESFFNHLQIAIMVGCFLGSPYFLYQLWAFIGPGLKKTERQLALPFVAAGTLFFFMGAAFAYYLVLPYGFKFFIQFGAPDDMPMITVKEYFSVLFRLLLLFGACFELPVILVLLAQLGMVGSQFLRKQRRMVILAITILSAIVAPPDVMSMLLMMVPLYIFFEGAIIVIRLMEKKKASQTSL